jgi:MerR family Zn(II)-responsive transcriptional regulator of zntA
MRHESPHRGPRIRSGRAQTPRRTASAGGSRTQSSPYTIGKLAALTQVSADTLRYYEREHLLQPRGKSASGYRLYDDEAARRIQFIRHGQDCGFTLAEIRELLTLRGRDSACCNDVRRVAIERKLRLESKIRSIRAMSTTLDRLIAACNRDGVPVEACPILIGLEQAAPRK